MQEKVSESQPRQCLYIEKCPFLSENQNNFPGLCQKLKNEFCLRNNQDCARLRLRNALGPEAVPLLLMPHQQDWADQILLDAGIIPDKIHEIMPL